MNWKNWRKRAGIDHKPYKPTPDETELSGQSNIIVNWGRTKFAIDPLLAKHMGLKAGDDITDEQAKLILGD
jgi:hypothetical protein